MLLRFLLVVVDEGLDPALQEPPRPHRVRVDSDLDLEIPDIGPAPDALLLANSALS